MHRKRVFPRLLILALALLTAACAGTTSGQQPNSPTDSAPISQSTLPAGADGSQIVARVNGAEITLQVYERTLTRYQQQQFQAADPMALRASVLNALIEQVLIDQAAAAEQISVSDAEIDAELAQNASLAGSPEAWQEWLASNSYTEAEFRETLRETLLTSRMRDALTQSLSGNVLQVHARHILVGDQTSANDVMTRLQNGEDFAVLAGQYSNDVTTREQGGDLGWFTSEELLEPSLAQIAFNLTPGAIAGPVATSLGYHIIQTLEREERPVPAEKLPVLAQTRFENWLASLKASATIETYL